MPEPATYELLDHVAVVTLDDGKANAFSPDMIACVNGLLDRAEDEAKAVVLTGRAGLFSRPLRPAGVIRGDDPEAARNMSLGGARFDDAPYGLPLPLVIAASGHATRWVLLLADRDYRIGTAGDFRIGLTRPPSV